MATKTTAVKTLAAAAEAIGKLPQSQEYASTAAMLEAAAPGTTKAVGQRVRDISRKAGKGVGRGRRYVGITPRVWTALYKEAQASKGQSKKAKTTPAKKKAAVKA